MAAKKKVFYKIPGVGAYVSREVVANTKYLQDDKTGKLEGRSKVKSKGDKIVRSRVKKDFVLVKKSKTARGHIRQSRKDYDKGQFI